MLLPSRVASFLLALGVTSTLQAQQPEPVQAEGPSPLVVEVLHELLREFAGLRLTVNERRYERRVGPDGQLTGQHATAFESRHTSGVVEDVVHVTGLSTVSSLDEAPRSCVPDKRLPAPAAVCPLRDTDVIVTLGMPSFGPDTASLLAFIVQNSTNEGIGTVRRVVEFRAVARPATATWKVVSSRALGRVIF